MKEEQHQEPHPPPVPALPPSGSDAVYSVLAIPAINTPATTARAYRVKPFPSPPSSKRKSSPATARAAVHSINKEEDKGHLPPIHQRKEERTSTNKQRPHHTSPRREGAAARRLSLGSSKTARDTRSPEQRHRERDRLREPAALPKAPLLMTDIGELVNWKKEKAEQRRREQEQRRARTSSRQKRHRRRLHPHAEEKEKGTEEKEEQEAKHAEEVAHETSSETKQKDEHAEDGGDNLAVTHPRPSPPRRAHNTQGASRDRLAMTATQHQQDSADLGATTTSRQRTESPDLSQTLSRVPPERLGCSLRHTMEVRLQDQDGPLDEIKKDVPPPSFHKPKGKVKYSEKADTLIKLPYGPPKWSPYRVLEWDVPQEHSVIPPFIRPDNGIPREKRVYHIEPRCAPGMVMGCGGNDRYNGTPISLWKPNGFKNQKWWPTIVSNDGWVFTFSPYHAKFTKFLDNPGENQQCQLWESQKEVWKGKNSPHQRWRLTLMVDLGDNQKYFRIEKEGHDPPLALEVDSSEEEAPFRTKPPSNSNAQLFRFIRV